MKSFETEAVVFRALTERDTNFFRHFESRRRFPSMRLARGPRVSFSLSLPPSLRFHLKSRRRSENERRWLATV